MTDELLQEGRAIVRELLERNDPEAVQSLIDFADAELLSYQYKPIHRIEKCLELVAELRGINDEMIKTTKEYLK